MAQIADTPIVQTRPGTFPWRLLIVAGLIAFAIAVAAAVYLFQQAARPLETVTINREFSEYLPSVGAVDGILETATANVPETFTQSDSAMLFNIIPLGTTVSEIRVPAVYRYHIRLSDPWKLVTHGQVCVVLAPQFEPSLPPAILTGQMEKSASEGWLRFNEDDDLTALEQGITDELNKRANDKVHRDYVREACRRSVAEFVKTWLMKEDDWRQDRFHQIVVLFPDEAPANGAGLATYAARPTVTFESGADSAH